MFNKSVLTLDELLIQVKSNLALINKNFHEETLREKILAYEKLIHQENFWQDIPQATVIMKEYNELKNELITWQHMQQTLKDLQELTLMAKEESDDNLLRQCFENLQQLNLLVQKQVIKYLFTHEHDKLDCYLEITAGMGGLDAQDFAAMLLRMYIRWCDRMKFKVSLLEKNSLDRGGIKSSILQIMGQYAYGYLQRESGVHRLVRISPFNAEGKRQTSFASVAVYPILNNNITIEILSKDLRIDTYKSSGAGGQHVNTTDSAVRITHIPTGLVVQSQGERSQHKNKEMALSMLKAKLLSKQIMEQEAEKQNSYKEKNAIDFGSQIRSYILHPYAMVKDHQTQKDYHNTKDILDGDLTNLIYERLTRK
ncbi:Peptide chain release factor RF2 [Candidatus Hepatincola sp. Pdp]